MHWVKMISFLEGLSSTSSTTFEPLISCVYEGGNLEVRVKINWYFPSSNNGTMIHGSIAFKSSPSDI